MAKPSYARDGSNTVSMDSLFMAVIDKRKKEIIDQVSEKNPALSWMMERKNTTWFDGGEQFIVPMTHMDNPNGGMIDEEEGISMDDFDPATGGIYKVKFMGFGVRLSKKEQRVVRGSTKQFSLIDQKLKITIQSARHVMSEQLWGGSGTGKQAEGIQRLIPATASASQSTVIGNINPSTYAWWRTQAINMSSQPASQKLEENMLTMFNLIEDETGAPDVIFTDRTTEEIYENNGKDFLRSKPRTINDHTFTLNEYKGMAIIRDKEAPSGEMRFITSDQIHFCVDEDNYFYWTGWKEIPNVIKTKVQQLGVDYNFARTEARGLGCIYNIAV